MLRRVLFEAEVRVSRFNIPSVRAALQHVAARNPRMAVRRMWAARQIITPGSRCRRMCGDCAEHCLPRACGIIPKPDHVTGMTPGPPIERCAADLTTFVRADRGVGPRVLVTPDVGFVNQLLGDLVNSNDPHVRVRPSIATTSGPHETDPALRDPCARDSWVNPPKPVDTVRRYGREVAISPLPDGHIPPANLVACVVPAKHPQLIG